MLELLTMYIIVAGSFSISSYFFIHLEGLKINNKSNDISYSISYLILSFILFIPLAYNWLINKNLVKGLYCG